MGCNYFARLKPSKIDKDCLKKFIDENKYKELRDKLDKKLNNEEK